jgi:hypothetical protein
MTSAIKTAASKDDVLTDSELDTVAGGGGHQMGPSNYEKKNVGGGTTTDPIGAWNQLLHYFGL